MDEATRTRLSEATRYVPGSVEPAVLARWQTAHAFEAEPTDPGEPYSIAVPPPNVTGALHMGHALNGTFQDVLIRLRRMQGRNVLWIFGMDHAGIAVQNVVERLLAAEGLTRHDLGRERFVERVWAWKAEYGGVITEQFQRLGCSMDYRRERFTMDDAYARAVIRVFVALHRSGYLFRDNRMINWCVRCHTAISDLEVEHREEEDTLYEIDYPLEGGGHVTVATVRPATMLGDTGVAVNPADERHARIVGGHAVVPLVERRVPVIADDYVDVAFGTGALKITPAHDPNDFELGRRHDLAEVQVIGFDGRMTEAAGERYAGLEQAEAGERVVEDLRARGLIRAERPLRHAVGHCSRCGTRVEPLVSLQWFCHMGQLAEPAIADVRAGRVRFHPQSNERIFYDWMESIRPWCVSRQLWWGHQLPVWYCDCGETIVREEPPERCTTCGSADLERDADVLDTWFSSALWPFATLGWPDDTAELRTWFPTHVLTTARDIINLWVARMMMSAREFLGDIPFRDVVINPLILAPDGRRMSKSLGTGVDPLELIDRYGADATRYGLVKMASTQDVRFAAGAIDEGSRLCNKLWNAARLILTAAAPVAPEPRVGEAVDAWILARLERATVEIGDLLEAYEFAAAAKALYRLVFEEVCDWYLEAAKLRLYGDDGQAREDVSATLLFVLDRTLRLCHPLLPHITEELWSFLHDGSLLMTSTWPVGGDAVPDAAAEAAVSTAFDLVVELRRLRDDAELAPRAPLRAAVDAAGREGLRGAEPLIAGLGHVELAGDGVGDAAAVPISANGVTLRVVDERLSAQLRPRLERRLETARTELERARRKLDDERFVQRAPAHLVDAERAKADRFAVEADELERRLGELDAGA